MVSSSKTVLALKIQANTGGSKNPSWKQARDAQSTANAAKPSRRRHKSDVSKSAASAADPTPRQIEEDSKKITAELIKKLSDRVKLEIKESKGQVQKIIESLPDIPKEINSPHLFSGKKPTAIAEAEERFCQSLNDSPVKGLSIREGISAGELKPTLDYITALIKHEKELDRLQRRERFYNDSRHKRELLSEISGACLGALEIAVKKVPDSPKEADQLTVNEKKLVAIFIGLYDEIQQLVPKPMGNVGGPKDKTKAFGDNGGSVVDA